MRSIVLLAIILMVSWPVHAQPVTKCDMTNFLGLSKKMGFLTHQEIMNFLLTFDDECQNNVEYSEWSNELLFEMLDNQTELTVKTIAYETKSIERVAVLKNLEEPLHDRFNIKSIIAKVEKVKFNAEAKREIVGRLKIADSRK